VFVASSAVLVAFQPSREMENIVCKPQKFRHHSSHACNIWKQTPSPSGAVAF
jgi:hypothetical protein